MKIFLTRHGLTVANRDQIVQGQSEYPLSDEGRLQSLQLAHHFSDTIGNPTNIISSPLLRARETAEILSEHISCGIEYNEIWMERRLGKAQGIDYETVRSWNEINGLPSPYEPIHGDGESWLEVYLRAGQALLTLLEKPNGTYIVVSHGGFLNAVLRVILGLSPPGGRTYPPRFRFNNTGYAHLEYNDKFATWEIVNLNSAPHLFSKKTG